MSGLPKSLEELLNRFNAGEPFEFVHFWGHRPRKDGVVSQSCFSQWFESPFEVDGIRYPTAEHFMMASKARLFNDAGSVRQILEAPDPGAAKALGRHIQGFVEETWLQHRFPIVCSASLAKFRSHPELRAFLAATGEKVLVEASPSDRIWGIGLPADSPAANNPNQWKGLNLLGFALMNARESLQGEV